jgi:hypothetical protein
MTPGRHSPVRAIGAVLDLDPYLSDVREVARRVRGVRPAQRRRLLSLCRTTLGNRRWRLRERERVGTVKTLVALAPASDRLIRTLLRRMSDRGTYEVHFTLFCFLDDLRHLPGSARVARRVPQLVARYLSNVPRESAHAAWMAGDLLGDHWPLRQAVTVLAKQATMAKFAAGRAGAIHGLAHALERAKGAERARVRRVLDAVSNQDPTARLRNLARLARRGHLP